MLRKLYYQDIKSITVYTVVRTNLAKVKIEIPVKWFCIDCWFYSSPNNKLLTSSLVPTIPYHVIPFVLEGRTIHISSFNSSYLCMLQPLNYYLDIQEATSFQKLTWNLIVTIAKKFFPIYFSGLQYDLLIISFRSSTFDKIYFRLEIQFWKLQNSSNNFWFSW